MFKRGTVKTGRLFTFAELGVFTLERVTGD